jgi:cellulose synthase/poly-beta-1,6-N-acetylglucosamine synthase-like glycosyltransferase
MLINLLTLSTAWFIISFVGVLLGGIRLRRGNIFLSTGWLLLVLISGSVITIQIVGFFREFVPFTGVIILLAAVCFWRLRDWNALGQVMLATAILLTIIFMAYLFSVTAFSSLHPAAFLIAVFFFFIEVIGLLLALSFTFENLDITCRIRWRKRLEQIDPAPGYLPKVSLHVPAYDEPPELVAETLRSLAALDYPDYEVLVVDNNTPSEATWRPLEKICQELGPRFRFLHLARWPGYKSGALNFALSQTAPDVELIALVDADYQVEPHFLRETVPAFVDPQVAFLQMPQDYRDYDQNGYFKAIYHSYKVFFDISMAVRNERNAIILGGTMGLIRRSVLQEIGGWDEWCITEDAEASLRILKRGYKGYFYNKTLGRGLMPLSFDGLKKQRFRWCFGGVQILKKHWEALMPWADLVDSRHRLTLAQRYFYLVDGLRWFTDVLNLLLTVFLLLVGVLSLLPGDFFIRPFTQPLIILPSILCITNVWRFVWVLRHVLKLSWGPALKAMFSLFSLSWVVAQACVRGVIESEGVFLRTPKVRSDSKIVQTLRVTQWESLIGLLCVGMGLILLIVQPSGHVYFLALLFFWQSTIYLAAPVYNLLSLRTGA